MTTTLTLTPATSMAVDDEFLINQGGKTKRAIRKVVIGPTEDALGSRVLAAPNLFTVGELATTSALRQYKTASAVTAGWKDRAAWKLDVAAGGAEVGYDMGPFARAAFGSSTVFSACLEIAFADATTGTGAIRCMARQWDAAGAEILPARSLVTVVSAGAGVATPTFVHHTAIAFDASCAFVSLYIGISATGGGARSVWFGSVMVAAGTSSLFRPPQPIVPALASGAEAIAGTDAAKILTPAAYKAARDARSAQAFTPNLYPDSEFANAGASLSWNSGTPNGPTLAMPIVTKNGALAIASPSSASALGAIGQLFPVSSFPSNRISASVVIREKLGNQGAAGLRFRLVAYDVNKAPVAILWPAAGNDAPSDATYYTRYPTTGDVAQPTTLVIAENVDITALIGGGVAYIGFSLRIETTVQCYFSHLLVRDGGDVTYKASVIVPASATAAEAIAGADTVKYLTPAAGKAARETAAGVVEESFDLTSQQPNLFLTSELDTTTVLRGRPGFAYRPAAATKNDLTCWRVDMAVGGGEAQVFMGPFFRSALGGATTVSAALQVLAVDPTATAGSLSRCFLSQHLANGTEIAGTRSEFNICGAEGISTPTWARHQSIPINISADHFYLFIGLGSGTASATSRSLWFRSMLFAAGRNTTFRRPSTVQLASSAEALAGTDATKLMTPATTRAVQLAREAYATTENVFPDGGLTGYGATYGTAQGWSASGNVVNKGGVKTLESPANIVGASSRISPLIDISNFKSGRLSASVVIMEKIGDQGLSASSGLNNLRVRLLAYDASGVQMTTAWTGYAGNDDISGGGGTYYTRSVPRTDITSRTELIVAENIAVPAGCVGIRMDMRVEGLAGVACPQMYVGFWNVREGSDPTWRAPPASGGVSTVWISPAGSDSNDGSITAPFLTGDKALAAINGVGTIALAVGNYTGLQFDVAKIKDVTILGSNDISFGRSLIRFGAKLTGVVKTAGYTNVYESTVAIAAGQPNWIWIDGVNDALTTVPTSEQHRGLKGRGFRLPCTKIWKTKATALAAARTEIDAAARPLQFYDAAGGKIYFSVPAGVDPLTASIYVSASAGDILFKNSPAVFAATARIRLLGVDVRYGAINTRGFRDTTIKDCSVLGGSQNCFDLANITRTTSCEAAGAGSGNTVTGDGFNGHDYGVWEHEYIYTHDNNDDGVSTHENWTEHGLQPIAEYNGGSGLTPAYGAQAVYLQPLTRKNAIATYITTSSKKGGIECHADPNAPLDNGVATTCEVYGGVSIGDKIGFSDGGTYGAFAAFMKAYDCAAYDSETWGYQCSRISGCRYSGTDMAKAKASGVTVANSTLVA